jgi:hypothetical protein
MAILSRVVEGLARRDHGNRIKAKASIVQVPNPAPANAGER